jgi:hypothetical protein
MTNIGLNQCEARAPTPRIVKKRAIEVQPDHAKARTPDFSRILSCPASKVEQVRLTRHTAKHIG